MLRVHHCDRRWGAIVGALPLLLATAALLSAAESRSLLISTVPGAFGVRYLPDRAVMTYTVPPPQGQAEGGRFGLSLYLPRQAKWAHLDREALDLSAVRSEADSLVHLDLPFGSHRLQLGWEGTGQLPPETALVPIVVNNQQAGALRARFSLQGMEATGPLPLEPGIARLTLRLATALPPQELSLTCGLQTLQRWEARAGALVSAEPLLIPPNASLSLRVDHYGLVAAPITAIVIEDHQPPSQVTRVDESIPDGALLVEAEAYTAAGGTPVKVDPGSHHDEHGGASVYNFQGDGAWLEWTFAVPRAGSYDLFARISCGSERSFRTVTVDGASPPGLALVGFPGTGGWGHAEGEWWLVRVTGAQGGPASLRLSAGDHTIRFTGVLEQHLNVDYLFLAPNP